MKPIILVTGGHAQAANGTPTYSLNCNYAEAIKRAGGIPILAADDGALAEHYAAISDGLFLTGGKDVAPGLYDEEQKFDFIITDLLRDDLEIPLIKAFVAQKKPIFGICRGLQILNVYFGGKLCQDIPLLLGGEHNKGICHEVELEKNSLLYELYGSVLNVNSYHHQGIEALGGKLKATAYAMAGETKIVEAFCHEALPISAVQWHPERMTGGNTNPADAKNSLPIFEDFINKCKK